MNTTKDEVYWWFEVALNEFPVAGKRVLLWTKNHGLITGSWNGKEWESSYGVEFGDKTVTHWRELPEPPKSKDGFDEWWGGGERGFVRASRVPVDRESARIIWEAAINSTKQ